MPNAWLYDSSNYIIAFAWKLYHSNMSDLLSDIKDVWIKLNILQDLK